MQTLRKKTSPLKYKNETTRFLGDGVSFKAKLIGILEVSEARGDRMCQEALSDLKMAIRAAGEHKQRITINIAIDGLRLRDEKTGDSLYHHPVHKISFIAQDMTDSRAFGYIFGSPDTGHRFFGIKTDKAASQVVIAMRDLFQVVFALKKKEIELAKQHLDTNRFTNSSLFLDSSATSTKPVIQENLKSTTSENKAPSSLDIKSTGTAVADLVDLELELNSLQQGLTQMERITPSDPFVSKDDPFGDSFTSYNKPILPPPPSSGKDRSNRSFEPSAVFNSRVSQPTDNTNTNHSVNILFSKDGNDCTKSQKGAPVTEDWFTEPNKVFEELSLVPEPTKDEKHEITKQEILSQFDVFTELDPLGTGKIKPYVDKKHFFKELKNPPKKVLNDLVSQTQESTTSNGGSTKTSTFPSEFNNDPFGDDPFVTEDPFAETDFTKQDPFEKEFGNFGAKDQEKNEDASNIPETVSFSQSFPKISTEKPSLTSGSNLAKINNVEKRNWDPSDKSEVKQENKLMRLHENLSFNVSSEVESAPEPPPRPESTLNQIKPPPLPPKKQGNEFFVRPPPRPPQMEELYFDYMDDYETVSNLSTQKTILDKNPPIPAPLRKPKLENELGNPERPMKDLNVTGENDYLTPVSCNEQNKIKYTSSNVTPALLPPPQKTLKKQNVSQVSVESYAETRNNLSTTTATESLESLDITLSQLTLSGLNELAKKLNISSNQLNNMTLAQLTSYLSNFLRTNNIDKEPIITENSNNTVPTFNADFAANFSNLDGNTVVASDSYDRYAVFRELINEEIKQTIIDADPEAKSDKFNFPSNTDVGISSECVDNEKIKDRYAALREIVESDLKSTESKNGNGNEDTSGENMFSDEEKIKSRVVDETNIINSKDKPILPNYDIMEYNTSLDNTDVKASNDSLKSPKSPTNKLIKSPVPLAITEIMHNNIRLNSGSLSDVVSGSSPDIDNTGSNSEVGKKTEDDVAGEAWAIFDQGVPQDSIKEKQTIPSEEGVSPWSSDSKEFGNSSPPVWQPRDSEGCGDQWTKHVRRDQDGWWDTSAEPEGTVGLM